MEREQKRARRARPQAECLEGRQLLSGAHNGVPVPNGQVVNEQVFQRWQNQRVNFPLQQRIFSYTAPGGREVTIRLFGPGTLAGTTVRPDGSLELVYDNTNEGTTIRARAGGGSPIPLHSIRDADLALDNLSGVGGNILRRIEFPQFRLVEGGRINLTAGIGILQLESVGRDAQLHLRDIPGFNARPAEAAQTGTALGVTGIVEAATPFGGAAIIGTGQPAAGTEQGVPTGAATGTTTGTGTAGLTPAPASATAPGTATGTAATADPGAQFVIPQAAEVAPTATPGVGTSNTFTRRGRTYTYANEPNGGRVLTSVSGLFSPGINLVGQRPTGAAGPDPAPPGTIIQIDRIEGEPGTGQLGNSQIFGYDATANALIRFDTITGRVLGTIANAGDGSTTTGVGLGRTREGRQVVLVGGASGLVRAFDVVTGAPRGQFTTASLDLAGTPDVVEFAQIDGIGSTDVRTMLLDSASNVARIIDVGASLASGQAVPAGPTFAPGRDFQFAGGASGLAGQNTEYALGAANFDTFTPLDTELGALTLTTGGGTIRETNRTPIAGTQGFIPVGTLDDPPPADQAFGSIDALLARVTAVGNGLNSVTLYNPGNLVPVGVVGLDYPTQLVGLSESFHPELVDSVLIDMQGDVQSFRARSVRGLVYNNSGNLNLLAIDDASDSTIVGLPVGHVDILRRTNVEIISTARLSGMRGDVTLQLGRRPVGPLSRP